MAKINCLFCNQEFIEKNILFSNEYWVAIYDGYPVSTGHVLLIPKIHINDFFNMISNERLYQSFKEICIKVKEILDLIYSPKGYNIGINNGKCAGQTIDHLHIHIIPRYDNDGGLPCGIRNVFPFNIANYLKKNE